MRSRGRSPATDLLDLTSRIANKKCRNDLEASRSAGVLKVLAYLIDYWPGSGPSAAARPHLESGQLTQLLMDWTAEQYPILD
jgi:hypothetical protein